MNKERILYVIPLQNTKLEKAIKCMIKKLEKWEGEGKWKGLVLNVEK